MKVVHEDTTALAIMCYLLERGCSLTTKNKRGQTATDILNDPLITRLLLNFAQSQPMSGHSGIQPTHLFCVLCSRRVTSSFVFSSCGHSTNAACMICGSLFQRCLTCNAPQIMSRSNDFPPRIDSNYVPWSFLPTPNTVQVPFGENFSFFSPFSSGFRHDQGGLFNGQSPDWEIIERGSRRGEDLLMDGLGNTYTRRTPLQDIWHCTKHVANGKSKCPVFVRQVGNKFQLNYGPHRHY